MKKVITGHDGQGKSVFFKVESETVTVGSPIVDWHEIWATHADDKIPVDTSAGKSREQYTADVHNVFPARDIFWRQGFTTTSMSQLLEAMDIGSGSFYAAFGSKPELFAQVIDKYQTWSAAQWERIRTSHQGLDAIGEFLNTTVVDVSDKNRRKGCLLVNSILEMEGVDTELHQQLVDRFNGLEQRLSVCLQEAKDGGTLREDLSVADGVGYLMTNIYGLRVASRTGLSRAEARQRVQLLIRMISRSSTQE